MPPRASWSKFANGVEAVMDGRIYIELVNAPFLAAGGSGDDFRDGIARAIGRGMKLYPSVPLSSRVRSSH